MLFNLVIALVIVANAKILRHVVSDFPVILCKATVLMRAEGLNRVADPFVIKIKGFDVPEKITQVRIFILAGMSRQEKDLVWAVNVLGPKFKCMFPGDPC